MTYAATSLPTYGDVDGDETLRDPSNDASGGSRRPDDSIVPSARPRTCAARRGQLRTRHQRRPRWTFTGASPSTSHASTTTRSPPTTRSRAPRTSPSRCTEFDMLNNDDDIDSGALTLAGVANVTGGSAEVDGADVDFTPVPTTAAPVRPATTTRSRRRRRQCRGPRHHRPHLRQRRPDRGRRHRRRRRGLGRQRRHRRHPRQRLRHRRRRHRPRQRRLRRHGRYRSPSTAGPSPSRPTRDVCGDGTASSTTSLATATAARPTATPTSTSPASTTLRSPPTTPTTGTEDTDRQLEPAPS